ncbi:hypothetical protein JKP88DRAFT_167513 [Tribonema minus]|uniref:Mannitol dehydrogenase n=1 Tax=Tribonema minus TaxID=303371 RepID=A0A835YT08_9STRA|nr:hypothetical protein JKP88DRAFT_167513 [Tribonema minus]
MTKVTGARHTATILNLAAGDADSRTATVDKGSLDGTETSSKQEKPKPGQISVTDGSGEFALLDADQLKDVLGADANELPASFFDRQFDPDTKPGSCGCKQTDEPFHVHFGLGRLGCGLVIPALHRRDIPFALVQRPSHDDGGGIGDDSTATLTFSVNGERVLDPLSIATSLDKLNDCGCVGGTSVVALSEDKAFMEALVKRATSFSSSLGPALTKVLPPLLEVLDDKAESDRPILYACENEHDPVDKLEEQAMHCVKCMVDRICVSRDIKPDANTVEVGAETFEGRIIVLTPLEDAGVVPFGGNVEVPKEKATAQFFYKRKFNIVNGMHSVLAFMTLRENGTTPETDCEKQNFTLIKPDKTNGDLRKEIEGWIALFCVQLLHEFGAETIAKAEQLDASDENAIFDSLLNWGKQALERFSSLDDYTDRIFGGERSNRWANRVRPLWVFTQESQFAGTETPEGRLLERAGVDEAWSAEKIAALSEYGASVCASDVREKFEKTQSCLNGQEA